MTRILTIIALLFATPSISSANDDKCAEWGELAGKIMAHRQHGLSQSIVLEWANSRNPNSDLMVRDAFKQERKEDWGPVVERFRNKQELLCYRVQAGLRKQADRVNEQRAEEARKRAAADWEAQRRAQQGDALIDLGLSIMNGGRASPQAIPRAGTTGCFLKGSYVSGHNRICNYNCMGSDASHTIGAAELCPLNR